MDAGHGVEKFNELASPRSNCAVFERYASAGAWKAIRGRMAAVDQGSHDRPDASRAVAWRIHGRTRIYVTVPSANLLPRWLKLQESRAQDLGKKSSGHATPTDGWADDRADHPTAAGHGSALEVGSCGRTGLLVAPWRQGWLRTGSQPAAQPPLAGLAAPGHAVSGGPRFSGGF